jgi:hypothetical protein
MVPPSRLDRGNFFVSQPRDGAKLLIFGTVTPKRAHHSVVWRG